MSPKKRKNPNAVALSRKATKARKKIPPEKRQEYAQKAARARWARRPTA